MNDTRIYIDCEFNGWMGELLSFAMVSDDGTEFYSVLPEPRVWDAWCFDNVLPVLNKKPVASFADFRLAFIEFLRGYRNPVIVADWPADLYYFNMVLLGKNHEESLLIPCRQELTPCDIAPDVPHKALSDARAIRAALSKASTMKDTAELLERLRLNDGPDNALDIAIEIALFKPDEVHRSVRANDAGTKVVYTRHDGDTDTCWAADYTLNKRTVDATRDALRSLTQDSK